MPLITSRHGFRPAAAAALPCARGGGQLRPGRPRAAHHPARPVAKHPRSRDPHRPPGLRPHPLPCGPDRPRPGVPRPCRRPAGAGRVAGARSRGAARLEHRVAQGGLGHVSERAVHAPGDDGVPRREPRRRRAGDQRQLGNAARDAAPPRAGPHRGSGTGRRRCLGSRGEEAFAAPGILRRAARPPAHPPRRPHAGRRRRLPARVDLAHGATDDRDDPQGARRRPCRARPTGVRLRIVHDAEGGRPRNRPRADRHAIDRGRRARSAASSSSSRSSSRSSPRRLPSSGCATARCRRSPSTSSPRSRPPTARWRWPTVPAKPRSCASAPARPDRARPSARARESSG